MQLTLKKSQTGNSIEIVKVSDPDWISVEAKGDDEKVRRLCEKRQLKFIQGRSNLIRFGLKGKSFAFPWSSYRDINMSIQPKIMGKTELGHQAKFRKYFDTVNLEVPQKPFLIYWKVGSGKTFGLINVLNRAKVDRVVIVCDLSVLYQWAKEIEQAKMRIPKQATSYELFGYARFKDVVDQDQNVCKNKIVIVDENHNFRSATSNMYSSMIAITKSRMTFLVTGTPLVNNLEDAIGLELLMKVGNPTEQWFEKHEEEYPTPDFYTKLGVEYRNRVSYYNPDETSDLGMPIVTNHTVKVPMSFLQTFRYMFNRNNYVFLGGFNIQSGRRNAYRSLERMFSNGVEYEDNTKVKKLTPKILKVVENVKKFQKPAVVYSNFLSNGIRAVEMGLEDSGLVVIKWTGSQSSQDRIKIQNDFNSGKIDVLLLSPAGRQGINLLTAKTLHMIEPSPSFETQKQIINRVVRAKSKSKEVEIFNYISIFPDKPPSQQDREDLFTDWKSITGSSNIDELIRDIIEEGKNLKTTVDEDLLNNHIRQIKETSAYLKMLQDASIDMKLSKPCARKDPNAPKKVRKTKDPNDAKKLKKKRVTKRTNTIKQRKASTKDAKRLAKSGQTSKKV